MNFNLLNKQRGAVLLAVIVVSLILTLLLSAAHLAMSQRLDLAVKMNQLLLDKAAAFSQLQELTYLTATQRVTRAGISTGSNAQGLQKVDGMWTTYLTGDEYRVDDFPYQAEVYGRDVQFSIQASNGLIPVNMSEPFWLRWYLNRTDVPLTQTSSLLDGLADYADDDDFIRPAGAEQNAYSQAGLPPPANFLLQQPSEILNVLGWQQYHAEKPFMTSIYSLNRSSTLNFNAIPLYLWKQLWPNSFNQVEYRRNNGQWFIRKDDVKLLVPELINISEPYYTVLANDSYILKVKTKGITLKYKITLGNGLNPPFKSYLRQAKSS